MTTDETRTAPQEGISHIKLYKYNSVGFTRRD